MNTTKKYFHKLLDADSAEITLDQNSFINGSCFRFGSTDEGGAGYLENIPGTRLLENPYLPTDGTNETNGGIVDKEKSRIIYFNCNTEEGNGIFMYDIRNETFYKVLLDSQVVGGLELNINYIIHSIAIIGDLLIWTNEISEIKCINIEAGLKLNHPSYSSTIDPYPSLLKAEDIVLIKRPPIYPPEAAKVFTSGQNVNFIENESSQYSFKYTYLNFEDSVLSHWSDIILPNREDEEFNSVQISMNLTEKIPLTAIQVHLFIKDLSTGGVQRVKTWDKGNPTELAEIEDHNTGTAITYLHNGKTGGITLSSADSTRIEDSIPPIAKTLATAQKRLFIGNYHVGFDQPKKTSLAISVTDANSSSSITTDVYQARVKHFFHLDDPDDPGTQFHYYSAYWVYLDGIAVPGWYEITASALTYTGGTGMLIDPDFYPVLGSIPTPVDFDDLTFLSDSELSAANAIIPAGRLYEYHSVTSVSSTTSITGVSTTATAAFKTSSPYQVGIAFYDRFRRRIGMFTKESLVANIPDRAYSSSNFKAAISWELDNSDSENEIPADAYYYSIIRTQNQRTRFFIQGFDEKPQYGKKQEDGTILIDDSDRNPAGKQYLAINLDCLLPYGMGYSFNEGDLCRIYFHSGTKETLKVVGTEGGYLLLDFLNLGTFDSSSKLVFEIYTPYKPSEEEFFYEVGNIYPVTSPGTSSRSYSVENGTLKGDVYILDRLGNSGSSYQAEAMSITDVYWQRWFTGIGFAFPKVTGKRIHKPFSIRFSNPYLLGTQINGISRFDVLDEQTLDENFGAIQRLILAFKTNEEGSVMLCIGKKAATSLYLGESRISDTQGTAFFSKSENVIEESNSLLGGFGTSNPESVVSVNGFVYWFSQKQGAFVRYAKNGIFPISEYGLRRVTKLLSDEYSQKTIEQSEALGNRRWILTGFDPYHQEALFSIPELLDTPPKGWLDDYFSLSNVYSVRQITRLGSTYYAFSGYFVYLNASDGWPYDGYYLIVSTITNLDDVSTVPAYPSLIDYPQFVTISGLYPTGATTEAQLTQYVASIFFDAAEINPAPGTLQVHSYEYEQISDTVRVANDTTDRVFPYDIWDGRSKTLVFKESMNGWLPSLPFRPEYMLTAEATLYSFKDGKLFEHGDTSQMNTFYGVEYPSEIAIVENQDPHRPKSYQSIAIEATRPPDFVHFRTEIPYIQSSDLIADDFKNREGVYYAALLRDRLSPDITGTPDQKLTTGDKMRGTWLKAFLRFNTSELLQVRFVNFSNI